MTNVLLVELDEALRGTLHMLLSGAGYAVREETGVAGALAALANAPQPLVVVWSNAHADHHLTAQFFAQVVAHPNPSIPHRFVLLSTAPRTIPASLTADFALVDATVLPKPFEMGALLAIVAEAAATLPPSLERKRTKQRRKLA